MTEAFPPLTKRPTRPLAFKPAGYVGLANYSSLGRLWQLLAGAQSMEHQVTLVRGDVPETARRRIAGYELPGAGVFVDTDALHQDMADGFAPHPALLSLLAGDTEPLRALLSRAYVLQVDFVVALTAGRELVVRPEFRYAALPGQPDLLPPGLTLRPRRLKRDELNLLLLRACGMA